MMQGHIRGGRTVSSQNLTRNQMETFTTTNNQINKNGDTKKNFLTNL